MNEGDAHPWQTGLNRNNSFTTDPVKRHPTFITVISGPRPPSPDRNFRIQASSAVDVTASARGQCILHLSFGIRENPAAGQIL